MDTEQEQLIDQFINVTGSSRNLAEQYLLRNKNDIMNAIEDYYASNDKSLNRQTSGINTLSSLRKDDEDDKTDTNFFTGGEKTALQVEDPKKKKKKLEKSLIEQLSLPLLTYSPSVKRKCQEKLRFGARDSLWVTVP